MRQIVLDTETTGLEVEQQHRIIEIGCVELVNRRLTGRAFHRYLNPERDIDEGAQQVHGLSREQLAKEPKFAEIHARVPRVRARCGTHHPQRAVRRGVPERRTRAVRRRARRIAGLCAVLDTLALARQMHPGQRNNLDALCKRYSVDNSHREYHGALLDARILAEVYLAMTGGQAKLVLSEESDTGARPRAPSRAEPLARGGVRIVVVRANDGGTRRARAGARAARQGIRRQHRVAQAVKMLVTGAAGFIGFHTARALLRRGDEVVGIDNSMPTTTPRSRRRALRILQPARNFRFEKLDIADRDARCRRCSRARSSTGSCTSPPRRGCATPLQNPHAYVQSNITGFLQRASRAAATTAVEHLVYASTSSVYGANTHMPFSEHQNVDHPLTLYAATKKANELMAHSYSSLYGLPTTGLRFFTVYGPWGRPDMALFLFTKQHPRRPADRRLQSRPPPARLHLRRRHRRGRDRVRSTTSPQPDPAWNAAMPRSEHQPRAVPDLQHRQSAAGTAAALHRGPRAVPGPQGAEEFPADAAGRRAGDLGGRRGAGA